MKDPLLLPVCWRSSYVSYFSPMRPADRITSGHVWFDYEAGVSRIDGIVNPWDEAGTGHVLWVSEINWFLRGVVERVRVAYDRSSQELAPRLLPVAEAPSPGPALPRDVLASADARRGEALELFGRPARAWTLARELPRTLVVCARTGLPLRLCTEKKPGHVSYRDFLTVEAGAIDPAVFTRPRPGEVA